MPFKIDNNCTWLPTGEILCGGTLKQEQGSVCQQGLNCKANTCHIGQAGKPGKSGKPSVPSSKPTNAPEASIASAKPVVTSERPKPIASPKAPKPVEMPVTPMKPKVDSPVATKPIGSPEAPKPIKATIASPAPPKEPMSWEKVLRITLYTMATLAAGFIVVSLVLMFMRSGWNAVSSVFTPAPAPSPAFVAPSPAFASASAPAPFNQPI